MLSKQALLNSQINQITYQNLVTNKIIVVDPFDNLIDDDLQNVVKKLQKADHILQFWIQLYFLTNINLKISKKINWTLSWTISQHSNPSSLLTSAYNKNLRVFKLKIFLDKLPSLYNLELKYSNTSLLRLTVICEAYKKTTIYYILVQWLYSYYTLKSHYYINRSNLTKYKITERYYYSMISNSSYKMPDIPNWPSPSKFI